MTRKTNSRVILNGQGKETQKGRLRTTRGLNLMSQRIKTTSKEELLKSWTEEVKSWTEVYVPSTQATRHFGYQS